MIKKDKIIETTKVSELIYFETIDSTNTYLMAYAKENPDKNNVLVISKEQRMGRGRRKKSFYSPPSGLYFSLLYRNQITVDKMQLVTIVAAVSIYQSFKELYNIELSIKWLNDLLLNDKKICGILTEGVLSSSNTYDFIIVGIGINIKTANSIPKELNDIYIALDHVISEVDENDLLISIIKHFDTYMSDLDSYQEEIMKTYRSKCITINQRIITSQKEQLYVYGIREDGHLLARNKEHKTVTINSGEVFINYEN